MLAILLAAQIAAAAAPVEFTVSNVAVTRRATAPYRQNFVQPEVLMLAGLSPGRADGPLNRR